MRNLGVKASLDATSDWFDFEGNSNLGILIGLHWMMESWKIFLFSRQVVLAIKATTPPSLLNGWVSFEEYETRRRSSISRCTATIVVLLVKMATKTLKLVLNYHPLIWELTAYYSEEPLYRAAYYAAFDLITNKLLLLPFAVLGIITSLRSSAAVLALFILSLLEIACSAFFASFAMLGLIVLTNWYAAEPLFMIPVISNLVGLLSMAYYIKFIVPEKLMKVRVTNHELKQLLEPMVDSVHFPIDHIYVDDTLPSPNAYFLGVMGANMIAVTPSLMKIMRHAQVTAVVAHELGHWIHGHNYVQAMFSIFTELCVGYGAYLSFNSASINQTFRFQEEPHALIPVYLWMAYGSSLIHDLMSGINSVVGCRCEYTADRFAVVQNMGSSLKSALLTLAAESNAFPLNDKWFSAWFLQHPSILERVKRIGET